MDNVLFDRKTLKVTGSNRAPSPFEIEIKNITTNDLKKEVSYKELENKTIELTIEDNTTVKKQLYILPQNSESTIIFKNYKIETTEVTENPIMINVTKKIPILDENNNPKLYEVTTFGETTEVTRIPAVIETETIQDGKRVFKQTQKTDSNGNLLFLGDIGTGIYREMYEEEIVVEQKKNELDELLFYKEIRKEIQTQKEKESLEITEDDERWTKELEEVKEEVEVIKIVTFEENPSLFNYDDVIKYKEREIVKGTFYSSAMLFEKMDEKVFSTDLASFKADLGFDFISLPENGEIRTIKLKLPKAENIVGIKLEVDNNLPEIKIGSTINDMQLIDQNNERYFNNEVSNVYVNFKNTSNERINIYSFALLV